jgi:hypothetical protein
MKKTSIALLPIVLAVACGDEPLRALPSTNTQLASIEESDEEQREEEQQQDDQREEDQGTAGSLSCADGNVRTSWRDALAALPAAAAVPETLELDDGTARATCTGDIIGDGFLRTVSSAQLHTSGRRYGEVTVLANEGGFRGVGVFAAPALDYELIFAAAFSDKDHSVAAVSAADLGVIGVAADLDAGLTSFYANGALLAQVPVSLIPGVGGYALGAVASEGDLLNVNLGAEPFTFAPPAGFAAWSSDEDGNACDSGAAVPLQTANIEGAESSFVAAAQNDVELIVLAAYDTGTSGGPIYNDDGEVVGETEFIRGAPHVQILRPGRIVLALSAYEATDWSLEVGADTQLEGVLVRGYHTATITGVPDGVTVDLSTYEGDGGEFPIAAHTWPFDFGGGDTQGFIDYVETQLCLPLAVFGGAYSTQSLIVH